MVRLTNQLGIRGADWLHLAFNFCDLCSERMTAPELGMLLFLDHLCCPVLTSPAMTLTSVQHHTTLLARVGRGGGGGGDEDNASIFLLYMVVV